MRFDWVLNPLTQYGMLAAGLLSAMCFCMSTLRRMRRERVSMMRSLESLDQQVSSLSAVLDGLGEAKLEADSRGPARLAGLNLTKRAQALRMHERGESLPAIAAVLESPRNEIELLLKLHSYLNS